MTADHVHVTRQQAWTCARTWFLRGGGGRKENFGLDKVAGKVLRVGDLIAVPASRPAADTLMNGRRRRSRATTGATTVRPVIDRWFTRGKRKKTINRRRERSDRCPHVLRRRRISRGTTTVEPIRRGRPPTGTAGTGTSPRGSKNTNDCVDGAVAEYGSGRNRFSIVVRPVGRGGFHFVIFRVFYYRDCFTGPPPRGAWHSRENGRGKR